MADCVFCLIATGGIAAELLHDRDGVIAFRDANPQAATHILIVPRQHLVSAAELTADHDALWWAMLHAAQRLAALEGVAGNGYRLVVNVGAHGGQTVPHLHLHLLGGRPLGWPPG
ncbi:MAG: histidine triad nucleotide-binding protein [Candidatus Dormibacteria bacterium]